jgi:hypothetical protein
MLDLERKLSAQHIVAKGVGRAAILWGADVNVGSGADLIV